MKSTLFIIGPSGVGKSNLEKLFSESIIRINPYRLRENGPRKEVKNKITKEIEKDEFYAPVKLKEELEYVFNQLGDKKRNLSENTFWYSKSKTFIFKVRETWQILPLIKEYNEGRNKLAKAEIYVTLLPHLLASKEFDFLGEVIILLLNPFSKSILEIENLDELKRITKENIIQRNRDDNRSISKRLASIEEEYQVWKYLLLNFKNNVIEYPNWEYPEYLYARNKSDVILNNAKKCLLAKKTGLKAFFED